MILSHENMPSTSPPNLTRRQSDELETLAYRLGITADEAFWRMVGTFRADLVAWGVLKVYTAIPSATPPISGSEEP